LANWKNQKSQWEAAKYGAGMAKKPVNKILRREGKVVTEITPEQWKNMMIAASQKIVAHQEEINRINFSRWQTKIQVSIWQLPFWV